MRFTDGSERVLDLDPQRHGPIFAAIHSDPQIYRAVTVDNELGTVVWPNSADMDPDVLRGEYAPVESVQSDG